MLDLGNWLLSHIVRLMIAAVNGIIAALGAVLQPLIDILPNMPTLPTPPAALVTAESWVAWFFPVATLVNILAFTLSMWLIWQLTALALRWAKALND